MSRVSLSRRLLALLEGVEQIDPLAAKLHRLPPATRAQHDRWRASCDAAIAEHVATGGPGAGYAALLEGDLHLPEPPRAVAEALDMPALPVLSDDLTTADLARMYQQMIGD